MTLILVLATARKGGREAGSIPPPPTVVVGGMTPNAVAATARRVAGVNFINSYPFIRIWSSHFCLVIIVLRVDCHK